MKMLPTPFLKANSKPNVAAEDPSNEVSKNRSSLLISHATGLQVFPISQVSDTNNNDEVTYLMICSKPIEDGTAI
jgi:hypothetical protein